MSRKASYWNNIPLTILGGRKSCKVLLAWGISPWGAGKWKKFGDELDYVGWQRVHLPDGWMISLERPYFFLLDDKNQVRGRIHRAFEKKNSEGGVATAISDEFAKAFKDDPETKKREKLPQQGPYLELLPAITVHGSFALGNNGPYSLWVENPLGEEIFGLRDVKISPEDYDEKIAELQGKIDAWLKEHYPRWKSPYFYWNRFV